MADRPLSSSLPADLPENWTSGQIVAPAGADVGLSRQHGYNYLMEQVNAAQRAANAINESFDNISGKRACRFVVGTSAAGWTQADCDYLCDGTDDQVELQAAIESLKEKGGGEIVVLAGEYVFPDHLQVEGIDADIAITGNPGSTVFIASNGFFLHADAQSAPSCRIRGITFQMKSVGVHMASAAVENCTFIDCVTAFSLSAHERVRVSNNTYIINSVNSSLALMTVSDSNENILIDGNTFLLNIDPASVAGNVAVSIFSSDTGSVIFSGNSVGAVGEFGEQKIKAVFSGPVTVQGNSFDNVDVQLDDRTLFDGNLLKNGSVFVTNIQNGNGISVSGNFVQNGSIHACGPISISGNVIQANPARAAIMAYRPTYSTLEDIALNISGNYIASGSVGIHLESVTTFPASNALISGNRIWGCTTPIQIESNWSRCMVTDNFFPDGGSVVDHGSENIIRLNSDDPGGSGGGTAGVSSFKGRSGAVVPQAGDYTAAMVGAVPTGSVAAIQSMTQAEYDALATKSATTLYLIKE